MRRLVFSAIMITLPLLILVIGAELLLRISGFGYRTAPLISVADDTGAHWVGNPDFTRLFFPSALKRLPPSIRVPVDKPENTRRFIVVGGSAVAGDPDPDFSIARILEWLLQSSQPQQRWEVINLAFTASNSHVAAEVVRQSARYQPDGIITMVGNNEVIGPFGPGTTLSAQVPGRWQQWLQVRSRQSKLGQLAQSLQESMGSRFATDAEWRGMEQFLEHRIAADDPRLDTVAASYRRNIASIGKTAAGLGIPVFLANIPVNLVHQPPFWSPDHELPDDLRDAALGYLQTGEHSLPYEDLRNAIEAFPDNPNLHFMLGNLLLQTGDRAAADRHLQKACDFDQLRFRADSRINAIITDLQSATDAPWVGIDAIAALRADHPQQMLGFPHFYEHVHFSFRANFRIAFAMADAILSHENLPTHALQSLTWNDAAAAMAYHEFAIWRILEMMSQRFNQPPFDQIPGYPRLVAWMETARADLARFNSAAANKQRIYEAFTAAMAARPDDDRLRFQLANFLGANQQAAGAQSILKELFPRHPTDMGLALAYFDISVQTGDIEGAETALARMQAVFRQHGNMEQFHQQLRQMRANQ